MLDQHRGRVASSAPGGAIAKRLLAKAQAHQAAGRFDRAQESLRRALRAEPNHPEVHYQLGLLASGKMPADAVTHFVAALRGAPKKPTYWISLASALLAVDRVPEARAILEHYKAQDFDLEVQALTNAFVALTSADAHSHYHAGKLPEAEALLDLVILLDDKHAAATFLAGAIAARRNRLELAFNLMSIAIYREPENALFLNGLSTVLASRGDENGALSALEKALELDPDLAVAHANIAGAYQRRSRHSDALRHAERAITLEPDNASAHTNRGSALLSLGRMGEAVKAFDRATALDQSRSFLASNRLFAKLYSGDVSPEEYAADALAFGQRLADPLLRNRPFTNDRNPDRPLRIGFVSGDLCNHALVRFFKGYLQAIDRSSFKILAYMTQAMEDEVSAQLRPLFDDWYNVANLDDDEAADLIEHNAVDILVDLSGHSAGNRLLIFARKPAPVQVTWIGHPGTTGLAAIDYRLTDAGADPVGHTEALHSERLWRLPRVSGTYTCIDHLPPVRARAPFEDAGYITFGCLNRLTKVGDEALETWARIMAEVPTARLLMVVASIENLEVRKTVEKRLEAAGMPIARIIFQPRVNSIECYYKFYNQIDIALDPFPYNGGTTSYDTLSMGVPFVTLQGGHAAGRTGASILRVIGLPDLIADNQDAYVDIGRNLACERDRLRAIRTGLRDRLYASPLMDHRSLAADVGDAFRTMWRDWLAKRAA